MAVGSVHTCRAGRPAPNSDLVLRRCSYRGSASRRHPCKYSIFSFRNQQCSSAAEEQGRKSRRDQDFPSRSSLPRSEFFAQWSSSSESVPRCGGEMGNCQATDAAAIVIQHPGGRVEKIYWPVPASEMMKSHPGHYVALISSYRAADQSQGSRFTRVRLLRPKDNLLLGHVYRLVSSTEVMKGLRARKQEKAKALTEALKKQKQEIFQGAREEERSRYRASGRSRQWRPSLQSISEVGG